VKRKGLPCMVFDGASLYECSHSVDIEKELILTLTQLIPIGNVTTYSSIAHLLNVHPRVVALVLKKNSRPIIYPCHRVVRSDGYIGGYTLLGKRADKIKEKLLAIEGVSIANGRVCPREIIDLVEQLLR